MQQDEPQKKKNGSRHVYETLHQDILTLKLRPGQMLDETSLAEHFGLSRSPIREALIRLGNDNLVVTLANRTTLVAPIELATFPKYVEALDLAQRTNTRLAARFRTEEDIRIIGKKLKGFEKAVASNFYLDMSESNKQFHLAIAAAGRNPYLGDFYARLLNEGQRMMHLHFEYLERTNEGYLLTDEHQLMLDAIIAMDIEEADRLAHAHTRQFQDSFVNFLRENYTSEMNL